MTTQIKHYLAATTLVAFQLAVHNAYAKDSVRLDDCETADKWLAAGEPYGHVVIETGPFNPKQGNRCLRLAFKSCQISWPRFAAAQPWGDSEAITFWLRADRPDNKQWAFRISADANDQSFSIDALIQLDFDGWQRVRLTRNDLTVFVRSSGARIDFSKIKNISFALMAGCNKPTVYIDDVRYERKRKYCRQRLILSSWTAVTQVRISKSMA